MKVKTTLRKIMDAGFHETFQRVMKKWPEAKDIHTLVKVAKEHVLESSVYQLAVEKITEKVGFQIANRKSCNAEEITSFLLGKYGRFLPDGKMTISGAAEGDLEEFRREKKLADECLHTFEVEHKALIDSEIEFEIPKQLVVEPQYIRKDIISAYDCFILEPILDLSKVSNIAPKDPSEDEET